MAEDPVDAMCRELASAFPRLDTRGFGVTGRILLLARHVEAARERVLDQFGLSLGDYDVLATLRRHGDRMNPRDLSRAVMITSGGLTKRLDRLEAGGYLERHADPHDRRGVQVDLTAKGTRTFVKALPALLAAEQRMVHEALGSEEEGLLSDLLRTLLLHQHGHGPADEGPR